MSIGIFGVLDRDAQCGVRGMNNAVITLTLRVTERGCPFEVTSPFGGKPEDHIRARDLAATLKRGMRASFDALDLVWVADHGEARFVARGVRAVEVCGQALPV